MHSLKLASAICTMFKPASAACLCADYQPASAMYTNPDLLVFTSTICNMSHHTVCKCFGLAIGEDVYDLWLPSVSRILDIDDMVWILCHLPSLVLSFIICIYFFFSLSYIL